ncbi:MAG TPA: ferritin family protein [bacterium]|nr:ferritin family protein [bacterium]
MNEYRKILLMAVNNEIEAYEFYEGAAAKTANKALKSIFVELADEELKHQRLLESFLVEEGKKLKFAETADYKIAETVELPRLSVQMSFVDAIALAMKKEEEAMTMYRNFAEASSDPEQKEMFTQLARMEQGHKTRLEALYTDTAFVEAW